jgi:hypothetical protein
MYPESRLVGFRKNQQPKEYCVRGHPMNEARIYTRPNGKKDRVCVPCQDERMRKFREKVASANGLTDAEMDQRALTMLQQEGLR